MNTNKIKLLALSVIAISSINLANASVVATAVANPTAGSKNVPVMATGNAVVTLTNTTGAAAKFMYREQICIDGQHCQYINKEVVLNPGQTFSEPRTLSTTATFGNSGSHMNQVTVIISGPTAADSVNKQGNAAITIY